MRSATFGLLCALALAVPAGAHPMPNSTVMLDFHEKSVAAEVRLPLGELEVAFGKPLTFHPQAGVDRYRTELTAYVARHISAAAPDGRPWRVQVAPVELDSGRRGNYVPPVLVYPGELVANVTLTPPAGAPLRKFTLHYDVIVHQLVTHVTLVSVRKDWEGGLVSGPPQPLAEVRWYSETLAVNRPAAGVWQRLARIVRPAAGPSVGAGAAMVFLLLGVLYVMRNGRWKRGRPVSLRAGNTSAIG